MDNYEASRKTFSKKILELAKNDKDIVVLTSDARGSVTIGDFAKELPEQFVEVGIAEQDEIGIAAGLTSFNKKPFVCAPACFLSARSLEQIKVDVVYSNNPVRIIGVSGGVSYGSLGYTHLSLHDTAVMRTFPNFSIFMPSDAIMMEEITEYLVENNIPAYVRVGRGDVRNIYSRDEKNFAYGKANKISEGKDITLVATGEVVQNALDASKLLNDLGYSARVLDYTTIKPFDKDAIIEAFNETDAIITIEEHSVYGGLGSEVSETIIKEQLGCKPVEILGIPDEIPVCGSAKEIYKHYGLDADSICKTAVKLIKG